MARARPELAATLEAWAPLAARWLLAAVLLWFGFQELWSPRMWTGYVPVLSPTSGLAVGLVLAHGAVLSLLAVALLAGIAPRTAAAAGAVMLLEVVLTLTVGHGLNDIAMRDLGVLGLAVAVAGTPQRRLVLTT
ncbi:MAG TPA: hypothetical protein VMW49_05485 [Candidatus Dormibacteraeota bacterium]|nr:hypothetical protein [Candidatus Dormibacteraeota bacterium]